MAQLQPLQHMAALSLPAQPLPAERLLAFLSKAVFIRCPVPLAGERGLESDEPRNLSCPLPQYTSPGNPPVSR